MESTHPGPSRRLQLFAGGIVFLFIWSLTTHGKPSNSGDEPHYLMVADSLLHDGDIKVENNYAVNGMPMEAHTRRARSGAYLPVHDVGLPILLLPIYAPATRLAAIMPEKMLARFRMNRVLFAYSLVGLTLAGITAAGAVVFLNLLAAWMGPRLAMAGALTLFLSAPILPNAFVVFPEVPALFISTVAAYYSYRRPGRLAFKEALLIAALIGLLPWFHRKYGPFLFGLAFVIAVRNRRSLAALGKGRLTALMILLLTPLLGLLWWTSRTWGNWGGPLTLDGVPLSLQTLATGAVGLVMDRENGLLAWAPMWFALPAAAWLARRDTWMVWIPAILLFLPSAAHDSWWAGWSPTGRLLAPLIPWIGLPLMLLLRNARSRAILAPLLLIQLFIVAYGWQHPRSFWPKGDGANAALENVPLVGSKMAAGFPSLRTSQIGFRDCVWPLTAVAVVSSLLVLSAKASRPLPPAVVETSAA